LVLFSKNKLLILPRIAQAQYGLRPAVHRFPGLGKPGEPPNCRQLAGAADARMKEMRDGVVLAYRAVVGRYAGAALAAWLGCQALHNKSGGSDRLAGASHGPQRRTGPGCASKGAGLTALAPSLAIIQVTTQVHANRIVRATGTWFVARSARSSFC
jgi:hypothetical protein